jgi:O-methyltransferase
MIPSFSPDGNNVMHLPVHFRPSESTALIKRLIMKCAYTIGLKVPADRLKGRAMASGFTKWEPLVPKEEFYKCIHGTLGTIESAKQGKLFGDYLEFGVSRGTSTALVYRALKARGLDQVRIFGFDSFEGLPPEANEEGWHAGQFHSTINATRHYLKAEKVDLDRITLIQGWFKETCNQATLEEHSITTAGLIMIDCDIYSASKEALFFCEPLIRDCAALVFDDWGSAENMGRAGQKEVFQEFRDAFPYFQIQNLPAYHQNARVFLVRRPMGAPGG